jgi:hypothetical protein
MARAIRAFKRLFIRNKIKNFASKAEQHYEKQWEAIDVKDIYLA